MGRLQQGLLATLDAVEAGAAVNIEQLEEVYVHVSGTFVGTVLVEVSFDGGTTWAQFDSTTAPKLTAKLPPCGHVRARCSAYTSGTAVVNYGGKDAEVRG